MNVERLTMFEVARREIRVRVRRLEMIAEMLEHWRTRGDRTLAELRDWTAVAERAAREISRAGNEEVP
jgi:hypothetical protein